MKIPASIRRLYDDQKDINERLKQRVDERIRGLKDSRWHYESRVKELNSFALKIESGRYDTPGALEDFFACTLVVANAAQVDDAERLISTTFALKQRRPPHGTQTRKSPASFTFDDLRLYVALPDIPSLPPTDLVGTTFEVQIKTFLQHAWSIATHDLVYKTDDANWSKERIAYQIKAMLEHAEVSIQEAESLAASTVLAKEDRQTLEIKGAIRLLRSQWQADELPNDVRRLAQNILALIQALQLKMGRLEEVLTIGKTAAGTHPSNLSPYATVVQYLFDQEQDRMTAMLSDSGRRTRVLIPQEIVLPAAINRAALTNAVFVGM